jgi:SAM-dependent methyltransferase
MSILDPAAARQELAVRLAALLYAYGARHVWAFGSIGQNRRLDQRSDIDLAVFGLQGPALTAARMACFAEARCRVDILPLETAPPNLRWGIRRDGCLIPRLDSMSRQAALAEPPPGLPTLHRQRIDAVARITEDCGVRSVIDFGCGHGWLIDRLWRGGRVARLTGVDIEPRVLDATKRRFERLEREHPGIEWKLMSGLLTWADPNYAGYEAATATELIEHLQPTVLEAFTAMLFARLRCPLVVLTTPNKEYNFLFGGNRREVQRRHPGHHFEWTRAEFARWCDIQARLYGYRVEVRGIGPVHDELGHPSQLAIFRAASTGDQ